MNGENEVPVCARLWSIAARRARCSHDGPAPVIWVRLPWHRRVAPGVRAWAVALMFCGKPVIIRGVDAELVQAMEQYEEFVACEPDIFSDEEIARVVRKSA